MYNGKRGIGVKKKGDLITLKVNLKLKPYTTEKIE